MWIIPKNLSTQYHSAPATEESNWGYETFCQLCERELTARSKALSSAQWERRLKRDKWMKHLYVRALPSFLSESFEESLTSCLREASHVLHFRELPAKENQQKTPDISTQSSAGESKSASRQLYFSKMWQELSPQKPEMGSRFSNMCLEIWNDWVSEQRQEYSQRQKSVQGIKGKESLSWPTPTARDWKDGTAKACANVPSNCLLGREVHKYPDLTNDNMNGNPEEQYLSPNFVEQLMGLEVGWTQLPIEWTD